MGYDAGDIVETPVAIQDSGGKQVNRAEQMSV